MYDIQILSDAFAAGRGWGDLHDYKKALGKVEDCIRDLASKADTARKYESLNILFSETVVALRQVTVEE